MELVLIRHGLPIRDDASSDPPLSQDGQAQSQRLAQWLMGQGRFDALYSSPMIRAVETSRPFAQLVSMEVSLRKGIEEFDRGSGRYIPMEELKRTDYAAWKAFVDAGFQGEVDIRGFQKRVVETLEDIINRHSGERVAVFCHGGVINVWAAHVLNMEVRMFFEPQYTSVHRFLCARSGQRNIVSLNETAHL